MNKKWVWRILMIGLPAIAIIFELFSVFDGNANTEPWTQLISAYVPEEIFWGILAATYAWLLIHFRRYYK